MVWNLVGIVVAFVAIAIVFMIAQGILPSGGKGSGKGAEKIGSYKARPVMSENEAEFFGRLVMALPEHYIFPQVSMSALLDASSPDKKVKHSDFLRIAQHRADYVVCDKECRVVAVVELDDKTHNRTKDQMRDARLRQAKIRTVRFQSNAKPDVDAVRAAILPVVAVPKVVSASMPLPT